MGDSLNIEGLKAILNNISMHDCGFEVFAVTDGEPRLKKINLTESGEDGGLKGILKNMILEVIRNTYLSEEASYSSVDNVADNQYKYYIIPQSEDYNPFGYIKQERGLFEEQNIRDIKGFIFIFRYDEQEVACYQKGKSITVPNRNKNSLIAKLFKIDRGFVLAQQKDPLVTVTKSLDALIINNNIITDNIGMMERSFNFQIFIAQKAKKAAESVAATGFFSNTSKLDEYLSRGSSRQKTYYKKMMRAIDSPVFDMTSDELFTKIKTVERWKGRFKEPIDGAIPLTTFKEVESLIDLLDERYTVSEVTGQEYDTDVKKKASNETTDDNS